VPFDLFITHKSPQLYSYADVAVIAVDGNKARLVVTTVDDEVEIEASFAFAVAPAADNVFEVVNTAAAADDNQYELVIVVVAAIVEKVTKSATAAIGTNLELRVAVDYPEVGIGDNHEWS
jgi:hypothetical protein